MLLMDGKQAHRPEQLGARARPAQLVQQGSLQHIVLGHMAHRNFAGSVRAVAHAPAAAAVPHLPRRRQLSCK